MKSTWWTGTDSYRFKWKDSVHPQAPAFLLFPCIWSLCLYGPKKQMLLNAFFFVRVGLFRTGSWNRFPFLSLLHFWLENEGQRTSVAGFGAALVPFNRTSSGVHTKLFGGSPFSCLSVGSVPKPLDGQPTKQFLASCSATPSMLTPDQ